MRQSEKKRRERQIASLFLNQFPHLRILPEGSEPPDFLLADDKGEKIGLELAEWLQEAPTARARTYEHLQHIISAAAKREGLLKSHNILILQGGKSSYPRGRGQDQLVCELLQFLAKGDITTREGTYTDFSGYPTLHQYIGTIIVWASKTSFKWSPRLRIREDGFYDPGDAKERLLALLKEKADKYGNLKEKQMLTELWLLVYYDRGVVWNPPYEGVNTGLKEIVGQARKHLARDHGFFDQIFLFMVAERARDVMKLYP